MSHSFVLLIFAAAFAMCLVWAALADVRARRIPNSLSIAVALLWVGFALAGGQGADWWTGLAVAGVVFVAGLGCFAMGWFGGGDVKLMAAIGLWAGSAHALEYLLITALTGGVLALITLAARRTAIPYITTSALFVDPQTDGRSATSDGLPYGLAIAAGGLWIVYRMLAG